MVHVSWGKSYGLLSVMRYWLSVKNVLWVVVDTLQVTGYTLHFTSHLVQVTTHKFKILIYALYVTSQVMSHVTQKSDDFSTQKFMIF